MSIKSEPCYWVVCDLCGERNEDSEFSAWSDDIEPENEARNSEWTVEGGNHICYECTPPDRTDVDGGGGGPVRSDTVRTFTARFDENADELLGCDPEPEDHPPLWDRNGDPWRWGEDGQGCGDYAYTLRVLRRERGVILGSPLIEWWELLGDFGPMTTEPPSVATHDAAEAKR